MVLPALTFLAKGNAKATAWEPAPSGLAWWLSPWCSFFPDVKISYLVPSWFAVTGNEKEELKGKIHFKKTYFIFNYVYVFLHVT